MNGIITLTTVLAIICSFILLIFVANFLPDNVTFKEKQFFNKYEDTEKSKIFLLGASGLAGLNTTSINQNINSLSNNIVVYNLAKGGDLPEKRINSLNEIINQKPKLILYGIDFRDFQFNEKVNLFPSPKEFFTNESSPNDYGIDMFLFNPRLVTQQIIQKIANGFGLHDKIQDYSLQYSPLISLENLYSIASEKELMSEYDRLGTIEFKIDNSTNNKNRQSLEKMIKTFQENNIKVVLFTIPHQKIFFDRLDDIEEEKFNGIMKSLSEEFKIDNYSINHKYEILPIWANTNHIAYNKYAIIYTEDIYNIILKSFN